MFVVKECSKCKEYKILDEFHRMKHGPFGYRAACKSCIGKYTSIHYEKNREKYIQYSSCRYKNNIEYFREWERKRRKKIERSEYRRGYIKKRRSNDFIFKLRMDTSTLIRRAFRNNGYSKKSRTHQILGCDFEVFKSHIEKQFTKGMTWENKGEWHLDHIYPVSLARDEQHLIELNHYTNFQPLWAFDNLSKGNKIVEKQLFLL